MGSNTIIAIVVGAILVIVGFSLWPVLNGAINSLYSYFRNSCDDGNGNRFLRVYIGRRRHTTSPLGLLDPLTYYSDQGVHGGKGEPSVRVPVRHLRNSATPSGYYNDSWSVTATNYNQNGSE